MRPTKLKFLKCFHDKARDVFKKSKYAKNLVQPIIRLSWHCSQRLCENTQIMDWWLDDLLSLNNQDLTDDIKTLPCHFKFDQWNLFYYDREELNRDSKKETLDFIACSQISGNIHFRKHSQTKNNQCTGQTSSV